MADRYTQIKGDILKSPSTSDVEAMARSTSLSRKTPSTPYPGPLPPDRNFERFLQEYTESAWTKDHGDNQAAMDTLLEKLDTWGEAEKFFAWTAQCFGDTTRLDNDRFPRVSNAEFRSQIASANWKGGEALRRVNSRLCSKGLDQSMDYIPLGFLGNCWLALRGDNTVMIPKEADSATMDLYHNVTTVNPNSILGARYDCVSGGQEKQTLLFAPLGSYCHAPVKSFAITIADLLAGSILATKIEDGDEDASITQRRWDDTGYVLALHIVESGSARDLYVIRNLTAQNCWEEFSDEEIYADSSPRGCFGQMSPFTLAKIKDQRLGLLKDSWERTCTEKREIEWTVLSTRRPEIVETGLAKDVDDRRLIPLFPSLVKGGG